MLSNLEELLKALLSEGNMTKYSISYMIVHEKGFVFSLLLFYHSLHLVAMVIVQQWSRKIITIGGNNN